MKILHLTLKKKWFDMILSGKKKEEYREAKSYWATRLMTDPDDGVFKSFDIVRFTHGYGKGRPTFEIECKDIDFGFGKREWGANGDKTFIIKLGKILSTSNISNR